MTLTRTRVGRVYLNNRYHDPTLATFISVDPLVTTTGQPYIYGAANPISYSDPSGLCADAAYGWYDDGEGACPADVQPVGGGWVEPPVGPTAAQEDWTPVGDPPAHDPNAPWLCGPPSGPPTAQTDGSCGWTTKPLDFVPLEGPNDPNLLADAADFLWENRGHIATGGAIAFCFVPATSVVACGYAAAGAWAVRSQERLSENGWSDRGTWTVVAADGALTLATFSLVSTPAGLAEEAALADALPTFANTAGYRVLGSSVDVPGYVVALIEEDGS